MINHRILSHPHLKIIINNKKILRNLYFIKTNPKEHQQKGHRH